MMEYVLYVGKYKVQLVDYWPDSQQAVIRWPKCTERYCEQPHNKGCHETVVFARDLVEWVDAP